MIPVSVLADYLKIYEQVKLEKTMSKQLDGAVFNLAYSKKVKDYQRVR